MRKILLATTALLLGTTALKAQTVATFDNLSLPTADTYYVNYNTPGADVGYDDGLAHFPCVYDTAFGFSFWSYGFAYSNKTDSVNGNYGNQYSSITADGYGGSSQYTVVWGEHNNVYLNGAAKGKPVKGFYITNSTYTYKTIRDGNMFSKKFGGTSGNDSDWYMLTIKGYYNGNMKSGKVEVYLADYRPLDNTKDSILNYWKWVDLLPLGAVDSLEFVLTSTDTGSFGMNTPAYFCMDNFTTFENVSVANTQQVAAKVYPNPAKNELFIEISDESVKTITVADITGKALIRSAANGTRTMLNIAELATGTYILQLSGDKGTAVTKFIKQ